MGFLVVSQENSRNVGAPLMTPGGPPDDKPRCMGLADRALHPRARTANRIHKKTFIHFLKIKQDEKENFTRDVHCHVLCHELFVYV